MNHYQTLGIEKSATAKEIKKAYRTMSKKHHPDAGGSKEAFGKVADAYATLSNEESRKFYDSYGAGEGNKEKFDTSLAELVVGAMGSHGDVMEICRKQVAEAMKDLDRKERKVSKDKAKFLSNLKRVYCSSDNDPVSDMLRQRVALADDDLRRIDELRKMTNYISDNLDNYVIDPLEEDEDSNRGWDVIFDI